MIKDIHAAIAFAKIELAKYLVELREDAGLTQEQLAQRSEIPIATIVAMETAESEYGITEIFSVCRQFPNVDVAEIYTVVERLG